jgi:hypothetical protein
MAWSKTKPVPTTEDLPGEEKELACKVGNKAVKEGNSEESAIRMAWEAIRKKRAAEKRSDGHQGHPGKVLVLAENTGAQYDTAFFDEHGLYHMQFSFVGEGGVSEKVFLHWVKNHQTRARGQEIILAVNHPFFTEEVGQDKRAYGVLAPHAKLAEKGIPSAIYRKGDEIWGVFDLNPLGKQVIENKEYLYLSPGWFPEYEHELSGEKVKDALFEVSFTNVPAQKQLVTTAALSEETDDGEDEDDDEEEELDLEAEMKAFANSLTRLRAVVKGKKGSPFLRAKMQAILDDATNYFSTKEKGENNMGQQNTLDEKNLEVKRLQEELDKQKKLTETLESREKALLAEQKKSEIMAWAEKQIPEKIFKTEKEGVISFALTLNDEQMASFKAFVEKLPAVQPPQGSMGTSAVPKDKKPMTRDEIAQKAMKLATEDPEWKHVERRADILEAKEAQVKAENGGEGAC